MKSKHCKTLSIYKVLGTGKKAIRSYRKKTFYFWWLFMRVKSLPIKLGWALVGITPIAKGRADTPTMTFHKDQRHQALIREERS